MVGLLLLTIEPVPASIWRWCSGSSFVVLLCFAITTITIFRRLDPQQLKREHATDFVFYVLGTIGTATTLLQLYNAIIPGVFWPFFTGIVVQLVTATVQFTRIILVRPT
jgi:hypothetical protein